MQPGLPEFVWPRGTWQSHLWDLIKIEHANGAFDLWLAAKSENNLQEGSFWSEKGNWLTNPEENIMQIGQTFWAKIHPEIAEGLFGYEELHTALAAGRIQAVSFLDLPVPIDEFDSDSDELEMEIMDMNHDGDGQYYGHDTQRAMQMSAPSDAFEHVYNAGVLFEGVLVPRIGVRASDNERANGNGDLLVSNGIRFYAPIDPSLIVTDPFNTEDTEGPERSTVTQQS